MPLIHNKYSTSRKSHVTEKYDSYMSDDVEPIDAGLTGVQNKGYNICRDWLLFPHFRLLVAVSCSSCC